MGDSRRDCVSQKVSLWTGVAATVVFTACAVALWIVAAKYTAFVLNFADGKYPEVMHFLCVVCAKAADSVRGAS
jgi:hypothetical protein